MPARYALMVLALSLSMRWAYDTKDDTVRVVKQLNMLHFSCVQYEWSVIVATTLGVRLRVNK